MLARFLMFPRWIREDGSIRPDAFIPYRHVELSVNRHDELSESELWQIGHTVARQRGKELLGRGDVEERTIIGTGLEIRSDPLPGNHNHANISGWPPDKASQKIRAIEIAAKATFVKKPVS